MSLSYEKAGVNIDNADAAKKQMAETMATGGGGDPRILHRPGASPHFSMPPSPASANPSSS